MTQSESREAVAGQRRGGRRNDVSYPKRPLLMALWIPAAAVLLPLGGALAAFGPWVMAPALVLMLTGVIGLIVALSSLCPSTALRLVALGLLVVPMIGVPLLGMHTAQATVLTMRGVAHPGTVTDVQVSHGKTTTYHCKVRYEDVPAQVRTVDCRVSDTVGERVSVTEDPGGLVDPAFSETVEGAAVSRILLAFFDAGLLAVAAAAAAAGALVHWMRSRREHPLPTV